MLYKQEATVHVRDKSTAWLHISFVPHIPLNSETHEMHNGLYISSVST